MDKFRILDYERISGTPPSVKTANKMAYVASWLIIWPIGWTGVFFLLILFTGVYSLIPMFNFIIMLGPAVGMVMAFMALVLRASHRGNLWVGLVGCAAWTVFLLLIPMFALHPGQVFPRP